MAFRLIFTMLFIALAYAVAYGQEGQMFPEPDPQPGVARNLAISRAANYSNIRYELNVSVFPGEDTMQGSEEIHVTLSGFLEDLVLDWRKAAPKDGQAQARVWDIECNGRAVKDAREVNDH